MWPESDRTQDILRDVAGGDAEAVNRLMDRHREAVRRMVQLRLDHAVARRVDASDVVQDVMLEASQRLTDYLRNPGMPFHLWLRQLALDRIIDMHRRHRGAQRRSVDREQNFSGVGNDEQSAADLAALLRDAELTPAAAALRKELQSRFVAALQQMDEGDREIIVMRHFEHLGNSEAAEALGLSAPAAGMRYLRAIRRLRELLGGDDSSLAGG
ncbi:MAG: sigma-70 family RNA polymerase sigma factor [Planctomyces sp.]|jgi:RNA polymerase sigma-70 factor (ECF subfamily)|nr:sigma-70 family RNA polymerase sigma factor [Planctomyces sp.]GDX94195.1 DNA-directed RNA polymerase sigma-70 factor [Planctomycetia bacterium]HBC61313.1 RNA polymerase factor sigma-70 [Planctomycetaceae bacterium]